MLPITVGAEPSPVEQADRYGTISSYARLEIVALEFLHAIAESPDVAALIAYAQNLAEHDPVAERAPRFLGWSNEELQKYDKGCGDCLEELKGLPRVYTPQVVASFRGILAKFIAATESTDSQVRGAAELRYTDALQQLHILHAELNALATKILPPQIEGYTANLSLAKAAEQRYVYLLIFERRFQEVIQEILEMGSSFEDDSFDGAHNQAMRITIEKLRLLLPDFEAHLNELKSLAPNPDVPDTALNEERRKILGLVRSWDLPAFPALADCNARLTSEHRGQ